jgi:tetratricopeptide (TPR) repeat protein
MTSIELDVQREWAERVVLAVNKVFPRHQGDMQAEKLASRCLDQVQRCYDLLLQYKLSLLEGADLLTRASHKMGPIDLNIRILECALEIREQHFEADHPAIAETLYYLAKSYFDVKRPSSSGKYGKAESLFMRALEIRERQLGTEHIDTVETRLSLAQLYQYRDRYSEAEQLYLSSLKILELAWGHESPKLGNVLNQIANFYALYEKHNEAKVFIQRYDHIQELRIQSKSRTKTVASGELSRDVWEPNALHLKNRLE